MGFNSTNSLYHNTITPQPMSLYCITPELRECIDSIDALDIASKQKLTSNTYISHLNLINLYTQYRPTTTLLQLLSKTSMYIPNKNIQDEVPKSKEFIKSMELLRLKAKEEEYQRLINPTPEFTSLYDQELTNTEYISPAKAHKQLKNQLTTIVNIFISVASVVYAIWYWTKTSWNLPDSYRILLCIFFGLLILVAEVVVYMGYLNKIEEAKLKELKKKEVKTVVKSVKLA